MAIIRAECNGNRWQEDFTPLVPRLYCYFTAVAARARILDPEELRQKCVLRFMARFINMWSPGKTLRIATCFIVWVRHDVVRMPVMYSTLWSNITCCSASSILPGRASGATLGCGASGTT